jgi:RNA polymerase sigma-70 factor (ECF subfamily)
VLWLEPYPDVLIKGFASNPETIYSQYESIRLAFLVALQQLPPRQRAVLLLRDVLAWRAKEVAEHLEMTLPAVNSALHRARRSLREHYQHRDEAEIIQEFQIDHQTQMMLDQYVQAWETADVKLLVSLLKEEATFAMPPSPSWYQGRNAIQAFLSLTLFQEKPFQRWRLLPTRANAQPSFGLYEIEPSSGFYRPSAIQVVTIMGGQFSDITTFLNPDHFPRFNLPIELEN